MSASIVTRGAALVKMRFLPGLVSLPNALSIGTVTTGAPGSAAAATVTGTAPVQVLNLTLPQGPQGAPNTLAIGAVATGAPGSAAAASITGAAPNQTLGLTIPTGAAGPANALTIGAVTTLAAGSPATATIAGASPNQTLSLGIPRGADGSGAVASVAGRTGAVTLTSADVGLGSVNNTSDANKPVSAAQSAAILAAISPAVATKTAAWTVAAADVGRLFVFTGAADAAVTLPSGASVGNGFVFQLKNASPFTLAITPNGSDTVDFPSVLSREACTLLWDGSTWQVIGLHPRALVNRQSVSGATQLILTLPNGYTAFDLEWNDLVIPTAGFVYMLTSFDGSTYANTNGDYRYSVATQPGTSTTEGANLSGSSVNLSLNLAGGAGGGVGRMTFQPGSSSNVFFAQSVIAEFHPSDGSMSATQGANRTVVGKVTALKVLTTAASFAGTFRLWGLR